MNFLNSKGKIVLNYNKSENGIKVEVDNNSNTTNIEVEKLEELVSKTRLLNEIYEITDNDPIEYINDLITRIQLLEEELSAKTTELNYTKGKYNKLKENMPRLVNLAKKVHQYNKKNYEDSENVINTIESLLD